MSAKLPDGHTLTRADLTSHFIGHEQDRYIDVVSALTNAIGNLIDLTNLLQELVPKCRVLLI